MSSARSAPTAAPARRFICRTSDTSKPRAVHFTPEHLFEGLYPWFSDFTFQSADDFHLTGTPSGQSDGWATYLPAL